MSEWLEVKFGQSPEGVAEVARGEDDRDLLRQQAPSHEHERTRRSVIEPLRVIDHT